MILLSLDFETTGLDVVNDRVIEVGAVLYSTGMHKCLDNLGVLVKTDKVITPEITKITGIHSVAVDKFGYDPDDVLGILIEMMTNADAVIGYNVRRFDRLVWDNWITRAGLDRSPKVWIDLFQDLPWDVPTGKLSYVAADHGILNLFPHSALADAQTVLAIANKYDPQILLDRATASVVVLQSRADRSQNDLVKRAKFRWNPTNKIWWRAVKEQDVNLVMESVQFPVTIEKQLTPEELDN